MKNIEIEIKVPVDSECFQNCKRFLDANGRLLSENTQVDEYFTPFHKSFVAPEFPFEWLSIRQRGDKCSLNYKHWYPENTLESTHCDEYDVRVSDAETLRLLLNALNIKTLVTVRKTRCAYEYEGEFEIALDEINELGCFVEIEYKGDATVDEANDRLRRIAALLNIPAERRDHRGYPYLMLQKSGLLGGQS